MAIITNDILYKGMIEDLFEEIILYFYPDSKEIFYFSKGFEFLDKELDKLMFPSSTKFRFDDKLVKFHTTEGE